jgi:methionyl-tRNA synthetase
VRVNAKVEPWLATTRPGDIVQFERLGYFRHDEKGGWNRAVTLKDTWAKIEKKLPTPPAKKKPEKKVEEAKAGEIGIEEFGKVDLRVGLVKEAGLVEGADKLIRVLVDLGEEKPRQIFAGLRQSYPDPSVLVGKRVVVVANLKPRQMKFGLSEGMILAAGKMALSADESAKPGDKVS